MTRDEALALCRIAFEHGPDPEGVENLFREWELCDEMCAKANISEVQRVVWARRLIAADKAIRGLDLQNGESDGQT